MTEIDNFINYISSIITNNIGFSTNLYNGNSHESEIRRWNLKLYLKKMQQLNPSILLIGEAPGYKGCRLTGIPFTSEVILSDNLFFKNQGYLSVNTPSNLEKENSALFFWETIMKYDNNPLIWNIFPFHPHEENKINCNRTPNKNELELGFIILKEFLKLFQIQQIGAIGRKAEQKVKGIEMSYIYIRHPSYGGKLEFSNGIKKLLLSNDN